MKRKAPDSPAARPSRKQIEALIDQIIVDAETTGEQLWAFRQAFEDEVPRHCPATVVGQPVTVLKFDFTGNELRGLTAICRLEDGSRHTVSAADVVFPAGETGTLYIAAYRRWMGLPAFPATTRRMAPAKPRGQGTMQAVLQGASVELVVLSVERLAVRCRYLGSDQRVTVRAKRFWNLAPGEILTLKANKQWDHAGHPYLSGEIASTRVAADELGLTPLGLTRHGNWDPAEEYWGEQGEPIAEWAKPLIARGRRPQFEMEQVIPGADPDDPFSDPIIESNDLKDAGDPAGAWKLLQSLCDADLRCLDAHAHLGNLEFDSAPQRAIRHYEIGVRIGELSLGAGFDGVLLWRMIDNRPFLRCLHGYGLCLWRLGQFKEALAVFERNLWMNPPDNQGVRMLVEDVRAGRAWTNDMD